MLLRIGVRNHTSIWEYQELSLVATSLRDGDDGLLKTDAVPGGNVLPGVVIYGANASGKSNLLAALKFMERAVLVSHAKSAPLDPIPRRPFALDPSASSKPSGYDIDFVVEGVRYHYGFEATDAAFISEWLYAFPSGRRQMLYERGGSKISFGRSLKGRNRVIAELMRDNSLFLSAAAQNGHEELTKVSAIFQNMQFSNSTTVSGSAISTRFRRSDVDHRTIDFLKKVGTGVTGFRRIEKEKTTEELRIETELRALIGRLVQDNTAYNVSEAGTIIELAHRNANGEDIFFDPDFESAGTRRLLMLVSSVFRALDHGVVLVVDELDASLHTQACEAVIALFADRTINPKGAQIIATTHDTNLMRSSALRRDQIWFTEKDVDGATHLFPLSAIQTRRTDNIEKGYLQGRFGAIPFAGPVNTLLDMQ